MEKECKLVKILGETNVFNNEDTIDISQRILPCLVSADFLDDKDSLLEGDKIFHKDRILTVGKDRGLYISTYEFSHIDIRKDVCQKVIATPQQIGWIGGGKLTQKGDKCLFYGQMSEVLKIQNPDDIYEHQSASIETELNDLSDEDKELLKTNGEKHPRMRHGFSCKQLFKIREMTAEFLKEIFDAGGNCSVKLNTVDDMSREPKGFCEILNQPKYHRINVVHFIEGKVVVMDKNSL